VAVFNLVEPLAAAGFTLLVSDLASDIVLSKSKPRAERTQGKAKVRVKWAWLA
jgi:hypothetical protein